MVQEVPIGPRGTKRSKRNLHVKRYLKVQEVYKNQRGNLKSKRYLKVQEVFKGLRGT